MRPKRLPNSRRFALPSSSFPNFSSWFGAVLDGVELTAAPSLSYTELIFFRQSALAWGSILITSENTSAGQALLAADDWESPSPYLFCICIVVGVGYCSCT